MELIMIINLSAYFVTLYFLVYWLLLFLENHDNIKTETKTKQNLASYPKITVLVPCFNEEKSIKKTLKTLLNSDYPMEKLNILVIDDGSTDGSKKIIRQLSIDHKNIDFIRQHNKGKGAALNKGLSLTKTKYFACVDADSFVQKNAIKNMVTEMEYDNTLTIVTPIMKIHKPKNWIQKFQRLEYMTSMLMVKLMEYVDSSYVAPGPLSVYRTEQIKNLGGFDEGSLVEDQEIAYRVQKHNQKIKQCTNAFVTTVAPSNFRSLNVQRNRWFKGSLINIFKYRSLMFNRKYGDFAYFQLPINLMSFVLVIISILSFGYYTLKPFLEWMKDLYLIRFDVIPLIKGMEWKFSLLEINLMTISIIFSLVFISLILLYYSSRMAKDKVRRYGTFYIIPYFFIYFILLGFVGFKVLIELLLGIRQKW